jgi:predicted Zn-ribbon and HTH transcriptional regulator
MSIIKRCIEQGIKVTPHQMGVAKLKNDIDPAECIECGEYMPDDARVQAGMKCSYCAYGSERNPETVNEDVDR